MKSTETKWSTHGHYTNIQYYTKQNGYKTYYVKYRDSFGKSIRIKIGSEEDGTDAKSTKERQGKYKKHIAPLIGNKPIVDVLKDDLVKIQKRMQNPPKKKHMKKAPSPRSNKTINITIELYSTIFNYGFKQELYNTTNVTKKHTKLNVINSTRERYLELVEIEELYSVVSNFDKDSDFKFLELFCRIAVSTGARLESVLSIKVKDINFNTDIITVTDFKNNNDRYPTYITDTTREYLLSAVQNKRTNDYIFEFKKLSFLLKKHFIIDS